MAGSIPYDHAAHSGPRSTDADQMRALQLGTNLASDLDQQLSRPDFRVVSNQTQRPVKVLKGGAAVVQRGVDLSMHTRGVGLPVLNQTQRPPKGFVDRMDGTKPKPYHTHVSSETRRPLNSFMESMDDTKPMQRSASTWEDQQSIDPAVQHPANNVNGNGSTSGEPFGEPSSHRDTLISPSRPASPKMNPKPNDKIPSFSTERPQLSSSLTSNEVILCYPEGVPGGVSITSYDLGRLQPGEFLNDTIVEFGLKLWFRRLEESNPGLASQTHVLSPFFYKKLNKDKPDVSYEGVKKWTKKIDLFRMKYIIVPIHENLHWYLSIVCQPAYILLPPPIKENPALDRSDDAIETTTYIFTFDSLGSRHPDVIERLSQYLKNEARHKLGKENTSNAVGKQAFVPIQPNNYDCGLFVLHFAETFMGDPVKYCSMIKMQSQETTHRNRREDWNYDRTTDIRERLRHDIEHLSAEWKYDHVEKAEDKNEGSESDRDSIEFVES